MNKLTYTIFMSIIGNTFLSILKICAGLFGMSISMIADGIHTFADQSLELVSMSNTRFEKNNVIKRTINLFLGILILLLGLAFIYITSSREIVIPKFWLLGISLLTILIKYVISTYLMEKGILYKNNILVNNARQSDADVLSSIIVFLGLILMNFSSKFDYFKYADKAIAIVVSLFVIYTGFVIITRELLEMFGTDVNDEDKLNEIKTFVEHYRTVIEVKNMRLQKYGPYEELRATIVLDGNLSLKMANELTKYIELSIKNRYRYIERVNLKVISE